MSIKNQRQAAGAGGIDATLDAAPVIDAPGSVLDVASDAPADAPTDARPHRDEEYNLHFKRMLVSWVISWGISVSTLLLVPAAARAPWFVLAMGIGLLISIVLQVLTGERAGFIARISYTMAGTVVGVFACVIIGFFMR